MKSLKFLFGLVLTFAVLSIGTTPAMATTIMLGGLAINAIAPQGVALLTFSAGDLTYSGRQIRTISEAIFEDVFVKPQLGEFHGVLTGVKDRQQIAYLGLLGLVGKGGAGCDPTADEGSITPSEKEWVPETISVRFEDCWADLQNTFIAWGLEEGVLAPDLTTTDYLNFVEFRLMDACNEAFLRHAWFGDKDAEAVTATPPGVITDADTVPYVNVIDGFWKQIFDIVGVTPARRSDTIAKNTGGTYALQEFDDTDITNKVVSKYFRLLIQKADMRLRGQKDLVIICTQSMADQYENELESVGVNASFEMIQAGVSQLKRKGVTIIAFDFLDRMIRTLQDDGTAYYLPHRAVLTTRKNLMVAVENERAMKEVNVFYDGKSRKNITEAMWKMDAKVIKDNFIQAVY